MAAMEEKASMLEQSVYPASRSCPVADHIETATPAADVTAGSGTVLEQTPPFRIRPTPTAPSGSAA